MTGRGYVSLRVWTKGMDFAEAVYAVGRRMPRAERYGMTDQMLRAAASVPANIAEGYQRGTRKDYAHYISIARGSLAEAETFLMLAQRTRQLTDDASIKAALEIGDEVSRMLTRLRQRLAEVGAPRPSPLAPRPS